MLLAVIMSDYSEQLIILISSPSFAPKYLPSYSLNFFISLC